MSTTQAGGESRADQAKETAQQATEQARQTAQQATEQARGRVRDEVDRRSTDAGQQASSVADAFRQSAQQLRQDGKGEVAKPIEQVADRVQSAGSWLERSSGDDILSDVEDFARLQAAPPCSRAAHVVGFALSRLLKASSTQRYEQRSTQRQRHCPHDQRSLRRTGVRKRRPAARRRRPSRRSAARRPRSPAPAPITPEPPRGPGASEHGVRTPRRRGPARAVRRGAAQAAREETTTLVRQELELAKAEIDRRRASRPASARACWGRRHRRAALPRRAHRLSSSPWTHHADWLAALIVAAVYGVDRRRAGRQGRNQIKAATPPVPNRPSRPLRRTWNGRRPEQRSAQDIEQTREPNGRHRRGARLQGRRQDPRQGR